MKIFEVLQEDDIQARLQSIGQKIRQAQATGDAAAAMQAGAEMGPILQNEIMPGMYRVLDQFIRGMEEALRKDPNHPDAERVRQELPKLKAELEQSKRDSMQAGMANLGRQDVGEGVLDYWGNMTVGDVASILEEAGRELGLKDRYLYAWRRFALDAFSKIAARQYAEENRNLPPVEEGKLKSKSYKKSLKAAKASGRRRNKSLRDSQENSAGSTPSGADMLAKVDMLLQNTGIKREGFKLVKDPSPQGSVRGSITQEAIDMIKATLAKAKAMGATEPEDPKPTMSKADITDKDFGVGEGMYETATSGGTSAGGVASVSSNVGTTQRRNMYNADGTMKNGLNYGNLLGGKKKSKKAKTE